VGIAQAFDSPFVRLLILAVAAALIAVLVREARKIPAKLVALMATAFVDMIGLLMVVPLLPFYVQKLGAGGVEIVGIHAGVGLISGVIVSAYTVAQLLSAPSGDGSRITTAGGRLLIALGASGLAY
jgi:hypothetical protein